MLGYSKFIVVVAVLFAGLLSSCTTDGDTVVVNPSSTELTRLEIRVSPGYPVIPLLEIPLRCIAIYNETAEQDWTDRVSWSVSDPTWANMSYGGWLRPNRIGAGEVRVESQDGWTASIGLVAQNMLGMRIQLEQDLIFISENTAVDLVASLADQSEMLLSSAISPAWSFTNPNLTHWTSGRELHGDRAGQTVISAEFAGVHSAPSILIVDSVLSIQCEELSTAPYLPLDTLTFAAIAQTQITGSFPVTNRVTWESSNSLALLPFSSGQYYAILPGQHEITAGFLNVTSPPLSVEIWNVTSLSISPSEFNDTLGRGDSVVFAATAQIEGHGSQEFTNRVEWVSSDLNSARFREPGVLIARRTGRPDIYAKVAAVQSQRVPLTIVVPELFADGFEHYSIGAFAGNEYWEVWDGNGYTSVEINDYAATGQQSCMFADSEYYETAGIATREFFSPLINGVVEFTVMPGPGCWIWVGGPSGDYAAAIVEFTYGVVQSNLSNVGTYEFDQWLEVRVEFDCATDRYDLYVNNVQLLDDDQFYYSQQTLDHFSCYNSPADDFGLTYADDFWLDGDEISAPLSGSQFAPISPASRILDIRSFTPDSRLDAMAYHQASLTNQLSIRP